MLATMASCPAGNDCPPTRAMSICARAGSLNRAAVCAISIYMFQIVGGCEEECFHHHRTTMPWLPRMETSMAVESSAAIARLCFRERGTNNDYRLHPLHHRYQQ